MAGSHPLRPERAQRNGHESDDPEFRILPRAEDVARAARAEVVERARRAIRERGTFSLALSGGSTPRRLHELLAQEEALDWKRIRLFWGDERCVPPDHPDSNFRMSRETLISRVPIPDENVFRMRGEATDPRAEAHRYETELRRLSPHPDRPALDLVLLGMGPDGHTASLFPNPPRPIEPANWVVAVRAPDYATPRERITLTERALSRVPHLLFLVTGKSKHDVLQEFLRDPLAARSRYPAAALGLRGAASWLLDREAAGGEPE